MNSTLQKLLEARQKAPPVTTERRQQTRPISESRPADEYADTKHSQYGNQTYQPAPPAYYVQAVIPGRAWLKDASGKIVSVGIGDQVQGYGTVTKIEPRSGTVITSSGNKIEYGISQY